MSQRTIEDVVFDVFNDILKGEAFEEAFCSVISHTEETEKWKKEYCVNKMKGMFAHAQQEEAVELALKTYIHLIYEQMNGGRVTLLTDLLESMVELNIVSARPICEILLHQEKLSYKSPHIWDGTFKLIRRIVGGVDYKGCRDILRMVLEKAQSIPVVDNNAIMSQINVLMDVINYILDRNACLLPAYFAINEITKVCPEDKTHHWSLGKVLAEFIDSFRPAAQMFTVSGRSHLVPIVGHSLSTSSVWRLNTSTLKFPLNGPLPYDKDLSEPQTGLLRYVLEQPYSREMVGNMLGLNKQVKQRCEVLEDQLVDLVVMAMERSENEDSLAENGMNQLLWQHLSSQVIYFVLFQFASFPHMVMSLYEKVKIKVLGDKQIQIEATN